MGPSEAVALYVTVADFVSMGSLSLFLLLAISKSDSDLLALDKFVWAHIAAWFPITLIYKSAQFIGINEIVDNVFEVASILSLSGPFVLNWMSIIDYTIALKNNEVSGLTS